MQKWIKYYIVGILIHTDKGDHDFEIRGNPPVGGQSGPGAFGRIRPAFYQLKPSGPQPAVLGDVGQWIEDREHNESIDYRVPGG